MADIRDQPEALTAQDAVMDEFAQPRPRKPKKPRTMTVLQVFAAAGVYMVFSQFGNPILKAMGVEDATFTTDPRPPARGTALSQGRTPDQR